MTTSVHITKGVNRTKTVRFYPFVSTGKDPRKGWRIPLNEIKYNEQRDEETCYGYCNDYQPHAVKRMFDYKNEMLYDMQWDGAGNLNQISYVDRFGLFNSTRHLAWTEDNRLYTVADERYYSYYAYDHTGQRTLKMTGDASTVDVNAWEQHTYGCLDHVTLYPSPYMVLTEQGYTNVTEVESRASSLALPRCSNVTERKHYYAGTDLCASREQSQACLSYAETKQSVRSNRVAARIGSGGLSYDATCVTGNGEVAKRSDELFWEGLKALNEHKTKPEDFKEMSLVDARGKEVDWHKKIDLDKLAMSWQLEAKLDPGKIHFIIDDNSYPAMPGNTRYENEPDVYFYHSDHLGSASWITDANGKPVQHLQYLPFGEPYVNQHPAGYQERYTFTGKERDEETGYGYFGARYMDHELMTMWLSVDPMADKYPFISPYAYCNWNPVKLVDPDGREVINRHTKNIENLKKKIADLEGQIKDCNGSNLKKLNRLLADKKKSLKKEMEYEKIVDNAIQDLKNYGGDEFEKLDQLTDINGNKVDVYIQMVDYIDKIGGPEGKTYGKVRANGPCSSEMGENTMLISLSHKYRDVAGKVLAHEGGHVLFDVKHPTFAPAFYKEHPTDKKTGHEPGNTSGLVAKEYERRYVENYNKSRR